MKNLITLSIFILLFSGSTFAQLVKINVGAHQVGYNQITCVPITMENFTELSTAQFCLDVDNTLATIVEVKDLGIGMGVGNYLFTGNRVCFSWNASNLQTKTIPSDSVFARICYRGISVTCDTTDITVPLSSSPEFIRLSATPANVFDFSYLNVGSLSSGCVSTQEPVVRAAISPNPTRDRFTVQTEVNWTKATIFDAYGRVVAVLPTWTQDVDLSAYSTGLYTIALEQTDGRIALGRVAKL
jgi:hypothetical protein